MKQTNIQRSQFTFYASYFNAVEHLPKTRRYEALRAIIRYALEGALPEDLSPAAEGVFDAIRPNLDSSRVKAAARLRDAEPRNPDSPSDSPTGKNKRENENEYKNEYKKENKSEYKKENKREYKSENESEIELEIEKEGKPAGENGGKAAGKDERTTPWEPEDRTPRKRQPGPVPGMTGKPDPGPGRGSSGWDDLDRLTRQDLRLKRVVDQLLHYWERMGQPLTATERMMNGCALSLREPEDRITAVLEAISKKSRLVSEQKWTRESKGTEA